MRQADDLLSEIDRFIERRRDLHDEFSHLNTRNMEMLIENERERAKLITLERTVMDDERRVLDLRKRQVDREIDITTRKKKLSFTQLDQLEREEKERGGGRGNRQPQQDQRRPLTPPRRMNRMSPPRRQPSPQPTYPNYNQQAMHVSPRMMQQLQQQQLYQTEQAYQRQVQIHTQPQIQVQQKEQRKRPIDSEKTHQQTPTKKARRENNNNKRKEEVNDTDNDNNLDRDETLSTFKRTITNDNAKIEADVVDYESDVEYMEIGQERTHGCICGVCDECAESNK